MFAASIVVVIVVVVMMAMMIVAIIVMVAVRISAATAGIMVAIMMAIMVVSVVVVVMVVRRIVAAAIVTVIPASARAAAANQRDGAQTDDPAHHSPFSRSQERQRRASISPIMTDTVCDFDGASVHFAGKSAGLPVWMIVNADPSAADRQRKCAMKYREFAILLTLSAFAATAAMPPAEGGEVASQSCDQQPVFSIDAANLDIAKATTTVTAYGTASTLGWKSPVLKRLPASGDAATVTFVFLACRPAFGAEVMTPISATATISATTGAANTGAVKHVVIQAGSNSQSLDVAQFQGKVHTSDPVVQN